MTDIDSDLLSTIGARAAQVDHLALFPRENIDLLGQAGLMGLLVPIEYGGVGGSLADVVRIAQALGAQCLSTAMIWAMHQQQVDAIVRHGSTDLRSWLLPRVAAGDRYIASVTTDPTTGADPRRSSQPIQPLADGNMAIYRLAPVVTGGMHAGGFLMTMAERDDDSRVTLVYADSEYVEAEELSKWDTLGMRATDSRGVLIRGIVPPSSRVGGPGGFRQVSDDSFVPVGHLAWAACWLGAARGGLESVVRLVSTDRGRATSELTRERLARARVDVEVVSAVLSSTLREVEESRHLKVAPSNAAHLHLGVLKLVASERSTRAIDTLMLLAGLKHGYSIGSEIELERVFRDIRAASLTYSNDRLWASTGALTLLDRGVRLVGDS